jgi:hypothetical protein
MYVVVNRLPLAKPLDAALLTTAESELIPGARAFPGVRSLQLVRVFENEAIIIVHVESLETLERATRDYAAPWFRQHVLPYLSGPSTRSVGAIGAGVPG